jgi:hypothetical protein
VALLELLEYVNDALFVGLAGVCYVQWRRQGGRAAAWLLLTFGILGGVVLLGLALSAGSGEPPGWLTKLLVAALVLFPYLLFRFTASLERAAPRTEAAVGALAAAVLAWTLLLPGFPAEGAPRPGWLGAYVAGLWSRCGCGWPVAASRPQPGAACAG